MHELITEVLGYVQNATRYKWTAIVAAWILCILGWIFVSQMPDQFQADARVHVDTRSVLRPLLQGLAVQPDLNAQIRLMSKLIFSRPNLEKVARMTDLDLGVKDTEDMDKLIKRLRSSVKIAGTDKENLFTISFEDRDPKTAKRVVQSLLTIFVEQALGESRADSDSAQKFLDQQIGEYEARLIAAEKAKEEFRRINYGLLPGQGGDLYAQLNDLGRQLDEAKMMLQEGIERRDAVKRQLEDETPMFNEYRSQGAASPLDSRIQALQARLDEMLVKYTKSHPEVVAVRKGIADLQRQRAAELAAAQQVAADQPDTISAGGNPVLQQMKIALGEADANVASLNSRVKQFEDKIETLKKQMDSRLKVETQLQGLTRDYETVKKNYAELLGRREQARLSENVEQNTDSVKFRIVDPPQVPTKPSAPNRVLFSVGVLVFGIAAGAGLAVFLSLLRPAFTTTQKLRDVSGLPVLGSVSMNWIPEIKQRKWREFLGFMAAFAMLLMTLVAVIALEVNGYHLRSFV